MTTIESLTAEIIIQILKTTLQLEYYRQNDLKLPSNPLHLSKVSRRWRDIVLGTPALFSNIIISFKELRAQNRCIRKWTMFWLERSGTHPINITFHLFPQELEGKSSFHLLNQLDRAIESTPDLDIFLDLLKNHIIPHIDRLQRFLLHYNGFTSSISSLLSPFMHADAPILEELDVRAHRYTKGFSLSPATPFLPLFRTAPKLRSLIMHGAGTLLPLTERLRKLDLCHVALNDALFLQFVSDCPVLETLALSHVIFTYSKPSSMDLSASEAISMNSLRSLSLDFSYIDWRFLPDTDPHKHILTSVLAPNLENIEVSTRGSGHYINLANVLPNPSSLTSLRRIKFVRISKETDAGHMDNSRWFSALPGSVPLEEIHLVDSSRDILGIDFQIQDLIGGHQRAEGQNIQTPYLPIPPYCFTPRSREVHRAVMSRNYNPIHLFNQSSLPLPTELKFKDLKSLTIETSLAEDIVWLCRILTVKPNIQSVSLSKSTLSTLRSGLVLLKDVESNGWFIKVQQHGNLARYMFGRQMVEEEGTPNDVEKWLKDRVKVEIIE
ncbi:hypothetical protein E1B28_013028 [Marasmius oreades]|uniref:F-box domain-containing protein n=1 Tax=Marasmius oreades TaxID=181124 RepID=A0A9P7UM79_9AGAR|nr:uncharacterized protein E1B28_013028 [Marasmius oreades]KAG7087048.1 hypothetical protein E1B28_013028 [Marasmius oreades]